MLKYILQRLFWAIPTLLIISLVTFGLSRYADFDPVDNFFENSHANTLDPVAAGQDYYAKAVQLRQEKPPFYCSFQPAMLPDSISRIFPPQRRTRLVNLSVACGSWDRVARFESDLADLIRKVERLPDSTRAKAGYRASLRDLLLANEPAAIRQIMRREALPDSLSMALRRSAEALQARQAPASLFIPAVQWHGADNQYHRWISGFLRGDLGYSVYNRPVWEELRPRFFITLAISGISVLLAYLLAIPLGVFLARFQSRWLDRLGRNVLVILHTMPVFWLGSLLMLLLATPGRGLFLIRSTYFPAWNSRSESFANYLFDHADKLILPVGTLVLHGLAVIALQMRSGIIAQMQEDYIRTARAKGLPERSIYWRHAFPNALFPIIAMFAAVFPSLFSGSLVIEFLFQVPGMGAKTQNAFVNNDYPVLFAILMLSSAMAIFGNLLGDLLFAWVDPRIRFSKRP